MGKKKLGKKKQAVWDSLKYGPPEPHSEYHMAFQTRLDKILAENMDKLTNEMCDNMATYITDVMNNGS